MSKWKMPAALSTSIRFWPTRTRRRNPWQCSGPSTVGRALLVCSNAGEGPSMSYEQILYEKAGPVLTITLNRPAALNAISPALEQELHTALDEADVDPKIRAVVLTGAGRAF